MGRRFVIIIQHYAIPCCCFHCIPEASLLHATITDALRGPIGVSNFLSLCFYFNFQQVYMIYLMLFILSSQYDNNFKKCLNFSEIPKYVEPRRVYV